MGTKTVETVYCNFINPDKGIVSKKKPLIGYSSTYFFEKFRNAEIDWI